MRARLVWLLAVLFVWIMAGVCGAAGWRLAQWWPPAAWIGLVYIIGFIIWQTQVTMRLQALLRRVDEERRFIDRVSRRVILNDTERHVP